MSHDPLWEAKHLWYMRCVENSCKYPTGSLGEVFWWSLRCELHDSDSIKLWANDPEKAIEEWFGYFLFKWEQLEPHRRHRLKPQRRPRKVQSSEADLHQKERRSPKQKGILRSLARHQRHDDARARAIPTREASVVGSEEPEAGHEPETSS